MLNSTICYPVELRMPGRELMDATNDALKRANDLRAVCRCRLTNNGMLTIVICDEQIRALELRGAKICEGTGSMLMSFS